MLEIHLLIASFTGLPELALEADEAKALSKALAEVQRFYPTLKIMSDKHMAIAGLGLTITRVYGKRAAGLAGFKIAAPKPASAPLSSGNGAPPPIGTVEPTAADLDNVAWFDTPPPPDGHTH